LAAIPSEWNATLIEGAATERLSRLKEELTGDLFLIGCASWHATCSRTASSTSCGSGSIPRWGDGARAYQGEKARMRLLDSTSYDSGVTLLRYEPTRL
jgi:hypothetical protein